MFRTDVGVTGDTFVPAVCPQRGGETVFVAFMFSSDVLTASRCVPAQTVTYFLLSSPSPSLFNFLCFSPCLTFLPLFLLLLIPGSWNNRAGSCKRRSCRQGWHHPVRWYIPLALNKKQGEEEQRCMLGLLCFCRFNLNMLPPWECLRPPVEPLHRAHIFRACSN